MSSPLERPPLRLSSQFFSNISSYEYTRKKWKKRLVQPRRKKTRRVEKKWWYGWLEKMNVIQVRTWFSTEDVHENLFLREMRRWRGQMASKKCLLSTYLEVESWRTVKSFFLPPWVGEDLGFDRMQIGVRNGWV